jgi:hypothetical protein
MALIYPYASIDFDVLNNCKFSNVHTFNFIDNLTENNEWGRFINYYFYDILSFMMNQLNWKFISQDKEKCIYSKGTKKFIYWTCEPEYAINLDYDYIYLKRPMNLDFINKKIYTTNKIATDLDIYEYTKIPNITGKNIYKEKIAQKFVWNKNDWPKDNNIDYNSEEKDLQHVDEIESDYTDKTFEYDISGKMIN